MHRFFETGTFGRLISHGSSRMRSIDFIYFLVPWYFISCRPIYRELWEINTTVRVLLHYTYKITELQ